MIIFYYIAAIVAANIITAEVAPVTVGFLKVPTGTFLVGAVFILRDLVQRRYGRHKTYAVITLALLLSAVTSHLLGDTQAIVIASAVAFLVSESADTEVFTRLTAPFYKKVIYSGLVSSTLDSCIFAVLGLSPIGAGFLPWSVIPAAITGQLVVKAGIQALAGYGIKLTNK